MSQAKVNEICIKHKGVLHLGLFANRFYCNKKYIFRFKNPLWYLCCPVGPLD